MRRNTCKKMIKKITMTEARQCLRKINHSGCHTPNLAGMKIGKLTVKRLGPPTIEKSVQWIVNRDGEEVVVRANDILSGTNKGRSSRSGLTTRNGKMRPEYSTVIMHHRTIFKSLEPKHQTYKGMPFCDAWNPNKGGAYWVGVKWIIENLGEKPKGSWSMDIVEHKKGFVPGNIRWAQMSTQIKNQQHRVLGKFSDEEFAIEARRRGYEKVKGKQL